MPGRDIVVIGGSAGGFEAIRKLTAGFPRDLPAAVLVVLHVSPQSPSHLPEILRRESRLPAAHARDGEILRPGRIFVAPPDRHLLVDGRRLRLGSGPRENRHRPAIDPLFRTAARFHRARVAAVLLSGLLDDGSAGLEAVKKCGGVALVQDPDDARHRDMPENALRCVDVDHCLPIGQLLAALVRVTRAGAGPSAPCELPEEMQFEQEDAMSPAQMRAALHRTGTPAALRCPDCSGPLWEMTGSRVLRYGCEVGHALSAESLADGQAELVERALWSAVSALEEKAAVSRRLAQRMESSDLKAVSRLYRYRAKEAEARAADLRRFALRRPARGTGKRGPGPRT